jgi:hypothetical protein
MQPSWHEITYAMAIVIYSVQHPAVTDYRIVLSRNFTNPWTWSRQVFEVSANEKTRLLEKENITSFQGNPYVLFYLDLKKLNFPQHYKAVFYSTDYFIKGHIFCRLVDITNWIIIPPPDISMEMTPNSAAPIVLRPGDQKDVQLLIKDNSSLPTEAHISVNQTEVRNNLTLTPFPSKVSISPLDDGFYTLHISVADNATPSSYFVPIVTKISFPNTITNSGGESLSNSKREILNQTSTLTVTIIPPYTPAERLNNFVSSWIPPMQALWTFFAGVGVVAAAWVNSIYRKKLRRNQPFY